jgi:polyphosphate glucokinase
MTEGILTIDIGGTGIKLAVIDPAGQVARHSLRLTTPRPCPPDVLLDLLTDATRDMPPFDRISVGFPGATRNGHILTAANLGNDAWVDYDLQAALGRIFHGKPVKVINDADLQGFALIRGSGLELAITLGTGFGTALFRNGELMPHIEMAHHPVRDNQTYDQYLGEAALERIGVAAWNQRLRNILDLLHRIFHPDHVVLAGGNARLVETGLPDWASLAPPGAGILGGAALWRERNTARGDNQCS